MSETNTSWRVTPRGTGEISESNEFETQGVHESKGFVVKQLLLGYNFICFQESHVNTKEGFHPHGNTDWGEYSALNYCLKKSVEGYGVK